MSDTDELERVLIDLVVRVRLGHGLANDSVQRASQAIDRARARWGNGQTISLKTAVALIAFNPDLEAVSSAYPDPEKQEIQDAAMRLNEELLEALVAPDTPAAD